MFVGTKLRKLYVFVLVIYGVVKWLVQIAIPCIFLRFEILNEILLYNAIEKIKGSADAVFFFLYHN